MLQRRNARRCRMPLCLAYANFRVAHARNPPLSAARAAFPSAAFPSATFPSAAIASPPCRRHPITPLTTSPAAQSRARRALQLVLQPRRAPPLQSVGPDCRARLPGQIAGPDCRARLPPGSCRPPLVVRHTARLTAPGHPGRSSDFSQENRDLSQTPPARCLRGTARCSPRMSCWCRPQSSSPKQGRPPSCAPRPRPNPPPPPASRPRHRR